MDSEDYSGDGDRSYSNDGGFSSGGDVDFGSSRDAGFSSGAGHDTNNSFRSNSIDQGKDNHSNWNQGPFATSFDEPDNTAHEGEIDGKLKDGDYNDKIHDINVIYPALEAMSIMKDPSPNENGEAPMSLLLDDSGNQEDSEEPNIDGCQPVDCLYYSLVCCCTIQ